MDPPPAPTATPTPSSTSSSTSADLPQLAILSPSSSQTRRFCPPQKCINTGADLAHFLTSLAYRDICTFIYQLNRALCPRRLPPSSASSTDAVTTAATTTTSRTVRSKPQTRIRSFPLDSPRPNEPPVVLRLRDMLSQVEALIDAAPPEAGPRRFGNVAFRRWFGLLEERVGELLRGCLGDDWRWGEGAIEEVQAYFLGGFGSAQRLDYGTGHELSFLAFLGGLWKLGVFRGETEGPGDGEVERAVVLGVFEPYLRVVRRLILTYNLEPAGSHGVWGLDDHSFLPYIFGSAQLTRPITGSEPMPLEGSAPGAPKPSEVVKPATVDLYRGSNMYFSAIGFINDVKKGPFWEHSPILYDVSGIQDGWGKINKGMIKMFNAEVLSKFPVVQHFPFGSLFSWDKDPDAAPPTPSMHMANQPPAGGPSTGPGIPYSRAPWAGTNSEPTPPRGGVPNTGPPPPTSFPRGVPGRANNQFSVTKAPWARD
ncbi:Serine/threonine-protein phosphatase 2A activator 1 [Madurella fahalii]|uniref:Serine/threonine-protein phosphatase 2A activator n=1 Tax=Madurella fahalii TaxID=1157608 RepID=A0ABQ0GDZ8_9PEZI